MNANKRNMTAIRPLVFALFVLAGVPAVVPAQAPESAQDPDWPCDQALVPQIAAAVVWDGPPVEGLAWRDAPPVVALVGQVTSPATTEAAATAAIATFAAGLPAAGTGADAHHGLRGGSGGAEP